MFVALDQMLRVLDHATCILYSKTNLSNRANTGHTKRHGSTQGTGTNAHLMHA
jgi:hypothetical protein